MRKANQTSFKKGNPGGGRKTLPADIRAARNMSYEDMCHTVIETRNMTPAELKQIDLENIPFGKRAIINAYAKMDYRAIKEYEDRVWGKAKETVALMDEMIFPRKIGHYVKLFF